MDRNQINITSKRMTEARAALIMDYPFFGYLSLRLQLACAPCGTACTDGERLIFDPEFEKELKTDQEMQFVILHEILHCALGHCTRRGSRSAKLFNIACDTVVNSTILEMWGLDTFPVAGSEPVHLAPNGEEGRNYSAEEVYDMLLKQESQPSCRDRPGSQKTPGKAAASPSPLDNHDIWDAIQDSTVISNTWNRNILEASEQCSGQNGPAEMPPVIRKIMDKLLKASKADWKQILHDFLQFDTFDYTFSPPDRRFSGEDFILPAFNIDEEQGAASGLWVCIDTSGSISDQQLAEVLAEVQDAMRQAGLTGTVSFFDTTVSDPVPFTTEEEFREIVPQGGGGTDFDIIFEYLRENIYPELPRAILIFTDGYVLSWPREEDAMGVPVLWLIKNDCNTDVPWGILAVLD